MTDPDAGSTATPERPVAATSDAPDQPPREPVLNLSAVVAVFILVCAGIHLTRTYLLTSDQDYALLVRAAFIPARYSGDYLLEVYAFTSPLTYSLLHGGFAHLAINTVWLAAFGSPLANRIGAGRFVAFWCATSLGAVLLHYGLHSSDHTPLIGASGAISGMMGAAARFGFRVDRRQRKPAFSGAMLTIGQALASRAVVTFLAIWMAVNLVSGLGFLFPDVDGAIAWEAHIGGFLVGFFGVRAFDRHGPARLLQ